LKVQTSIKDPSRLGRSSSASNKCRKINGCLSFTENLDRTAQEHEVNKISIHNILKKKKFYPYKIRLVHELNENDFNRCVEFCEGMIPNR